MPIFKHAGNEAASGFACITGLHAVHVRITRSSLVLLQQNLPLTIHLVMSRTTVRTIMEIAGTCQGPFRELGQIRRRRIVLGSVEIRRG